jgi:hypothetical protein
MSRKKQDFASRRIEEKFREQLRVATYLVRKAKFRESPWQSELGGFLRRVVGRLAIPQEAAVRRFSHAIA